MFDYSEKEETKNRINRAEIKIKRIDDYFCFPNLDMPNRFKEWIIDQINNETQDEFKLRDKDLLAACSEGEKADRELEQKIDSLADILGYEWNNKPQWVKKKKVNNGN